MFYGRMCGPAHGPVQDRKWAKYIVLNAEHVDGVLYPQETQPDGIRCDGCEVALGAKPTTSKEELILQCARDRGLRLQIANMGFIVSGF